MLFCTGRRRSRPAVSTGFTRPPGAWWGLRWTRRGVFRSIVGLQAAINRFLAETNDNPKPVVWTANPDKIIAAVRRGHQVFGSVHWRRGQNQ